MSGSQWACAKSGVISISAQSSLPRVRIPAMHGKLDYLHFNDNYRAWDDDLMVGSVHLVEYLELIYWLKRLDYRGWFTLDIFPYREDGVQAASECRAWLEGLMRAVERVGTERVAEVIRQADACACSRLVREALSTDFASADFADCTEEM